MNEKKAVSMVNDFAIRPEDYKLRVDEVITLLSLDQDRTRDGVTILFQLVEETEILLGEQ